jgi:ATP-dependent DNA ligase
VADQLSAPQRRAALRFAHERAQLYAFDMLAGDGENYRLLPLSLRVANGRP